MMHFDKLWRIVFPLRCIVCGKLIDKGYVCGHCQNEINRLKEPKCAVCARPFGGESAVKVCFQCMKGSPYSKLFVPFEYNAGIKIAIRAMKYGYRPGNYRFFAREIAAEMGDFRPDFITFVPQDRKTRLKRGYNQTLLMAKEIGRLTGVKVIPSLIRRKHTAKQVTLSARQRLQNAKKLFKPMNKTLCGTALLIDDVVTTGGTVRECSRLLKSMGCREVYAAAAAKTVI